MSRASFEYRYIMMVVICLMLTSIICLPFVVQASDYIVSKDNPCIYKNGGAVSGADELIACASKNQDEHNAVLNEVWQCVVSKYSEGLKKGYYSDSAYKALLAEQQAWVKFRDSACLPYTYDFGREGHIHFAGCRAELVLQRAQYLNRFMDPSTEDTCLGKNL